MDAPQIFEAERPRLLGIASRVLNDRAEAEDIVQQAWLRLHRSESVIESLPAWLTTVTTRLCLDRLSPQERVAFVLHDSFGFQFATIAAVLETTPAAARKLASRARAKVGQPGHDDQGTDWEVVNAFMAAARGGISAGSSADAAAILAGTPQRLDGRHDVAAFFDGLVQHITFRAQPEATQPQFLMWVTFAACHTSKK